MTRMLPPFVLLAVAAGCSWSGTSAAYHLARGGVAMSEYDHARAVSHYDRVVAARPEVSIGYVARGRARLASGRYPEALSDFQAAVAIGDVGEATALRYVCETRLLDTLAAARPGGTFPDPHLGERFDRAVALAPGEAGAYLWRGLYRVHTRQDEAAARDLESYGRLRPARREAAARLFADLAAMRDGGPRVSIDREFVLE